MADKYANNKNASHRATVAARRRLAMLHPDDYRRLLDEERERQGLAPASKRGRSRPWGPPNRQAGASLP